MQDQKKPENSKKLIALAVAAVVLVAAMIGGYVWASRSDDPADEPAIATTVPTEAPADDATEAPEEEPVGASDEEPEAVAVDAQADPNDVMALINGVAATRGDFDNYRTSLISYFAQQGYDMEDAGNLAIVGEMALNAMVEDAVIDQKAAEMGIDQLSAEEIAEVQAQNAAQWEETIDMYMYYSGLGSDATEEDVASTRLSILAELEAIGYTESAMLENALENARYEKVYAEIVKDAKVTDAEIEAAYEEHVEDDRQTYENDIAYYEFITQYYGYPSYYTPAGYRGVTHILLEVDEALLQTWQSLAAQLEEYQDELENGEAETGDGAEGSETEPVTQEQVDAAYAAIIASVQDTIDEINEKLAAGTPFADLVAEYGTDPGMTVEPTKTEGYPVHMDSIIWDPAFVAGAFSVDEVGAVAEPVVGSYGVHIIQYTRDVPSGAVELTDELRAELADEVLASKESELYQQIVSMWKADAQIVYSDEAQAVLDAAAAVGE